MSFGQAAARDWNYLQLELVTDDALVRPMIGPGGLSRAQAHREVQSILTRLADVQPAFRRLVRAWDAGAPDDTVYAGPFTWAIYQAADPMEGAKAWIADYAETMRRVGVDVGISW